MGRWVFVILASLSSRLRGRLFSPHIKLPFPTRTGCGCLQMEGKEQCRQFCPQLPAFPAAGWVQLTAVSHTFQGHLPDAPFLTMLGHAVRSGPRQWKQDDKRKLSFLLSHSPRVRRL